MARGGAGQQATSWPGEYAPLFLCERRISFLSDAIGVLSVHRNFIPEFADFSSCYTQAILERMHITPSGIEDFTSH